MRKKQYLTLGIFSCLVLFIIGGLITISFVTRLNAIQAKRDERIKNLYALLCEPFNAETTPEELLNHLSNTGDYVMNGYFDSNVYIVFDDPVNKEIYGPFIIIFHNGKYVGASISTGFEQGEVICSFR